MHPRIYKCSHEERPVNQDPIERTIFVDNKMSSSNRLKRLMQAYSTHKRMFANPRERVSFQTPIIGLLMSI